MEVSSGEAFCQPLRPIKCHVGRPGIGDAVQRVAGAIHYGARWPGLRRPPVTLDNSGAVGDVFRISSSWWRCGGWGLAQLDKIAHPCANPAQLVGGSVVMDENGTARFANGRDFGSCDEPAISRRLPVPV